MLIQGGTKPSAKYDYFPRKYNIINYTYLRAGYCKSKRESSSLDTYLLTISVTLTYSFSITSFLPTCPVHAGDTSISQTEQSNAFRFISARPFTNCLPSLIVGRNVASLAIFFSYFHVKCSSGLANGLLPLLRSLCTRLSTPAHPYAQGLYTNKNSSLKRQR